jgi:hypothetical protein
VLFLSLLALALAGCVGPMCEPSPPIADKAPPAKIARVDPEPPSTSRKTYPCDCPDQRDSIGRRCGGRSACLKESGRVPSVRATCAVEHSACAAGTAHHHQCGSERTVSNAMPPQRLHGAGIVIGSALLTTLPQFEHRQARLRMRSWGRRSGPGSLMPKM